MSFINFKEQASDPSTPSAQEGRLYIKNDGVYFIDDAGVVVGPFMAAGAVEIINVRAAQSANTSTVNPAYELVSGMALTPATAGKYRFTFSAFGFGSVNAQQIEYGLFKNNVLIPETFRQFDFASGRQGNELREALHTQDDIDCNGTDLIEAQFRTATGTFTVGARSLLGFRLGA